MRTPRLLLRAAALAAALLASSGPAASAAPDAGPIPMERRTVWNPGIPGGIPKAAAIHATIDAAKYGDGRADATGPINAAIQSAGDAAGPGRLRVVYLPPGTYRTTGIVNLNRSHVVLRGAGRELTRIRFEGSPGSGAQAIRIGVFWPEYHPPVDVVGSVPKGARNLTVADASGLQVGDVVQIDQLDDPSYVKIGDQIYGKRGPRPLDVNGPTSPGGYRSVGQQLEIASKTGNTLGLAGPTHIAFDAAFSPQVFKTATARANEPGTRYLGLEDLAVTGGQNNNVFLLNVAFAWVKNVESDGDPANGPGVEGAHVALVHAYRCEVRGSYVHHARKIEPGGGAYGIALGTQSSDNLVEDNIVVRLNKPIVLSGTGGGNVVAYNYVDDAFIAYHATWQETAIDANHGAFPHYDLIEGNWAPNVAADSTHGNSGWQTFFRNYATGMNTGVPRTANVRAVGIDGFNREYNVVGNVLLRPGLKVNGVAPILLSSSRDTLAVPAAYRIGAGSLGGPVEAFDDGTALRTLLRHGNFDYATNRIEWDPRIASHELPPSLYLKGKPAFFGDELWPFVDPGREPKVGVLPAKKRFDAMGGSGRGPGSAPAGSERTR
jgi:pectate lyase-like protein